MFQLAGSSGMHFAAAKLGPPGARRVDSLLCRSAHAHTHDMTTPVLIDQPARSKLVKLPVVDENTFDFIFSSPFTKGSDLWKQTPRHLQHHALPDVVPAETPSFRDGATGELICRYQLVRRCRGLSFGRVGAEASAELTP